MRSEVWYHLYNLKNVKNTHWGVLLLLKLQVSALYKRYQTAQKHHKEMYSTEQILHDNCRIIIGLCWIFNATLAKVNARFSKCHLCISFPKLSPKLEVSYKDKNKPFLQWRNENNEYIKNVRTSFGWLAWLI